MRLASYKAYDFVPSGPVDDGFDYLALGTDSREIILCSLSSTSIDRELARSQISTTSDENLRINCLRFAGAEPWLAVGLSSGEVILLHSETLRTLSWICLEPAEFGPSLAPDLSATHAFTSLCFSFSDSYLAAGATDGQVRIWCVKRIIGPLTELCRRRIRGLCPKDRIRELPLHPIMQEFLSESLVHRSDWD